MDHHRLWYGLSLVTLYTHNGSPQIVMWFEFGHSVYPKWITTECDVLWVCSLCIPIKITMNVIWFRSGHCISTRITTESDMVSSLVSVYIIQESLISSESGQSYILPKNHYRLQRNSVYHQYLATPFTHHLDSMSGNLPALPIVKCEVKASLHKLEFHVAPPEMHVERTYLPATLHLTLHSDPSGYSSKFTLAFFLLSVVYKSDQLLIKKTPPGEGGTSI